jgi:hypothetical protein
MSTHEYAEPSASLCWYPARIEERRPGPATPLALLDPIHFETVVLLNRKDWALTESSARAMVAAPLRTAMMTLKRGFMRRGRDVRR